MRALANIFWLGTKELRSFLNDFVLLGLVIYAFSLAIIAQAQSRSQEVHNASIAIVDEDHSELSRRIAHAFLPPYFQTPQPIAERNIVPLMNSGRYTFVIDVPPNFQRDVLGGRRPEIQLNVDATAMVQAGLGADYAQQIITTEINDFLSRREGNPLSQVNLLVRIAFNPNVTTAWFTSVMGIINNITMLAIILAGAAVVREREHGTMDHLLVMPLTPFEIAMSKIWANGLVIVVAVGLSRRLVVHGLLGIPIAGSIPLFLIGAALYLFFATAIGIFLGTIARSMPQLGLLYLLVFLPMNMLPAATRRSKACRRGWRLLCRRRRRHISCRSRKQSFIAAPAWQWFASYWSAESFWASPCSASGESPARHDFASGILASLVAESPQRSHYPLMRDQTAAIHFGHCSPCVANPCNRELTRHRIALPLIQINSAAFRSSEGYWRCRSCGVWRA
jgi:ABC-2 type transport system permease protein